MRGVLQVCKHLAAGSDAVFQKWCNGHRWARPLVPRGRAALALFPFGAFFRFYSCAACQPLGAPMAVVHGVKCVVAIMQLHADQFPYAVAGKTHVSPAAERGSLC